MSKNPLLEKLARHSYPLILLFLAAGCGGGNPAPPPPPAPAVTLSSGSVTFPAITQGAAGTPVVVTVTNSGNAALTVASVAFAGANPTDFANNSTCSGSIAPSATCTITVNFVPIASGPLSETVTLTDNAANSPQVINVTGTANAISISVTPPTSAIGAGQTLSFSATGDPNGVTWSVVGFTNGGPGAAVPAGTIDASGNYTSLAGSSLLVLVNAVSKTDPTKSATATVNVVAPGAFAATNNVQVAQYTVSLAAPANISVQFGLTTAYGLTTWTQPNGQFGGPTVNPLYVAGMKQSTPYHMRGVIQFADGTSFNDADFTFTTGALPASLTPTITATTTVGMTPQSGVELLDMVIVVGGAGKVTESIVTDLSGNILWAYGPSLPGAAGPNPVKLMANGHFLINNSGQPDGVNTLMQEVDLGGNVIWQMDTAQLNAALASATCAECNVTVIGLHHDFQVLPNGHLIVLASLTKTLPDATTPTGDIIIDLGDMENVGGNNPNHVPQPVWAWNEFNHLDTNRRPYSYPDWTHTNALLYSKDDGNLIISSRHQNWLVKIDYNNGSGAGDILWKLGAVLPTDTTPEDTADFALTNADGTPDTNATDWFFAQHGPSFTTANTTGNFGLVLFDNGDDRGVVDVVGGTCGVTGQPACFSTVPVFNIDESAKTATFVINPTTVDYSWFGGNAEVLQNGNVEYDECDTLMGTDSAAVYEITQNAAPQIVWQMKITPEDAYRAMRMPSLYPGVQW
ncbi:MAG TPA: aryl-sulfate sulfotransferase [Candidatus Acidoferrum sp.]